MALNDFSFTFASLVKLSLFSTSQLWAVWCKASGQSSVTSRSSAALIRLPSYLVYIIFRTPTQSSSSHLLPTRCMWTHLLSSMLSAQFKRYFRWGKTRVMFTVGNRCISCYATLTMSKRTSGQYPTRSVNFGATETSLWLIRSGILCMKQ